MSFTIISEANHGETTTYTSLYTCHISKWMYPGTSWAIFHHILVGLRRDPTGDLLTLPWILELGPFDHLSLLRL